ncbi:Fic family protein [Leptospira alexanderi]|uniref:Fic/DOC family protein n=1 Tax=Leptospira alexanderi serovar Manhao 3 str. L 60 TaxID=1049759 RepID=V6I3W8_9LEPT|nr:Fic/DOC family N-terminal domain-containing protein [Leptospira alexanderi]EQA64362.1 Fic/DOC family protein [Leptospira alexanderi serovar Manhao 3 str. L 60]
MNSGFVLEELPPACELETKAVLKKVSVAQRYLAELKGVSSSIPNQNILIHALSLQEAKDSSAVENIITTHDELFKEEIFPNETIHPAAKEVGNYASALRKGFQLVKESKLLTGNHILVIQEELERNKAGYRRLPGTDLKNQLTGEVIYTPPQHLEEIKILMKNLEHYINDDDLSDTDFLIKMAVIHYQFKSIHPFYDGNGRTGRILNILYLVLKDLLTLPILYLSRYIIQNKIQYYELLQGVRDKQDWESWVLFILTGVEETAKQTIETIQSIKQVMMDYKHRIRSSCKFYSQDLINNLFYYPYTKIEFIEKDLGVARLTAAKYLEELCKLGFLKKQKWGRSNYYINLGLYEILVG